jgi:hypothetical protein
MSDNLLRLIPEQPEFEPSSAARDKAVCALRALIPSAVAVNAHLFEEIRFVDQGSNFERILCPHCKQEITSNWPGLMEECSKFEFTKRRVIVPCCQLESDLNELVYEWPAGFARFVLEVENPVPLEWLPSAAQMSLEGILGCRVRQILTRL